MFLEPEVFLEREMFPEPGLDFSIALARGVRKASRARLPAVEPARPEPRCWWR
ncbi:hypothetical protein BH09PLA1_BH09PLA1_07280 [soil metagenome]